MLFLEESKADQLARLRSLKRMCKQCAGLFWQRLFASFEKPPALSETQQIDMICNIMRSIAKDPYIVSMHSVENLHADSKQTMSRCMHRRKRLQTHVVAGQSLGRWSALHACALGKRRTKASKVSIKARLKKPKVYKPRQGRRGQDGHCAFVAEQNLQRMSVDAASHTNDYEHLTAVHQRSRDTSEAERAVYDARASVDNASPIEAPASASASGDAHVPGGSLDTPLVTPWGLGDSSYPVSASNLRNYFSAAMPDAPLWLRDVYGK